MSAGKHTPGPWVVSGYDVRQPCGRLVAYTGPHHTQPEDYPKSCKMEDEANARLIAAAPDLLEACKWAVSAAATMERLVDDNGKASPYYLAAIAAIAKAEGRANG